MCIINQYPQSSVHRITIAYEKSISTYSIYSIYSTYSIYSIYSTYSIYSIYTSPPDERVELLKPMNEIEDMNDECKEICISGLLEWYCKSPTKLENLTFANWVAWYDCSKKHM